MGRLENFIPRVKKELLQVSGEQVKLSTPRGQRVPLEEGQHAFLKHLNGSLSLQEVFLFLNKQGESLSIRSCLELLRFMAEEKILANEEDYYRLNSRRDKRKSDPPRDASFFSEDRLVSLIQKTTLFLKCDQKEAKHILAHSQLEFHSENSLLLEQGTQSPYFYVLLSGEVGIFRGGECLAHLDKLAVFGESAAIFNKRRNADVITNEESWLLKIKAPGLIDTQSPKGLEVFKGLRSRLILNQTLASNPLFQSVPSDVMQLFISKCRIEKWGSEQVVVEQDESSGDFYFILNGSVSVIRGGMPVTSLAEGEHFGEVAALFNLPRTATVITESPCTFLALSQKSLFEVLCGHFRLAVDIESVAQERLESSDNVLQMFDDEESLPNESEEPSEVSLSSSLTFDEDFFEATQSHFDLEVVDFSKTGSD